MTTSKSPSQHLALSNSSLLTFLFFVQFQLPTSDVSWRIKLDHSSSIYQICSSEKEKNHLIGMAMARRMATFICLFVVGLSFAAAGDVTLDDDDSSPNIPGCNNKLQLVTFLFLKSGQSISIVLNELPIWLWITKFVQIELKNCSCLLWFLVQRDRIISFLRTNLMIDFENNKKAKCLLKQSLTDWKILRS